MLEGPAGDRRSPQRGKGYHTTGTRQHGPNTRAHAYRNGQRYSRVIPQPEGTPAWHQAIADFLRWADAQAHNHQSIETPVTLTDLLARYIHDHTADWAAGNLRNHRQLLKHIDGHPIGKQPYADRGRVNPATLGRHINALDTGAPTKKKLVAFIVAAYQHAIQQWIHDGQNPAVSIEIRDTARPVTSADRMPTDTQIERLREWMHGDADTARWQAATALLFMGLRAGEITGLRWHNLDLEEGTVRIVEAVQAATDQLGPPKSTASIRALHIPPTLLPPLHAWRHESAGVSEFVFFNRSHGPSRSSTLTNWFRLRGPLAGEGVTPHGMRAWVNTRLANAGLSDEQRGRVIGNSDEVNRGHYLGELEPSTAIADLDHT